MTCSSYISYMLVKLNVICRRDACCRYFSIRDFDLLLLLVVKKKKNNNTDATSVLDISMTCLTFALKIGLCFLRRKQCDCPLYCSDKPALF